IPQATPAPSIRIEPINGGAESPGDTRTMSPITATMKPTIWIKSNRSPLCRPQRIMVACTAPNKSSAPVPAERSTYANEKAAAYAKSASAEIQLPARPTDEPKYLSTKGEAALLTINLLRNSMMSQSAAAPEKMRTKVKVAASTVVCFSAARQSSELLANAIIASSVSMKTRVDFTTDEIRNRALREKRNRKPGRPIPDRDKRWPVQ